MTDAERLLRTVHHAGHALLVSSATRLVSFADAGGDPLPRWLSREIDAHVLELVDLCRSVACAQCARPGTVPIDGMRCSTCDTSATGGAGRVRARA